MEGLGHLEANVRQLLSSDNSIRNAAEQQLNEWTVRDPGKVLVGLLELVYSNDDDGIQSLAIVLFRRKALTRISTDHDQGWTRISPDTREALREKLLHLLQMDRPIAVRNKLADTVTELTKVHDKLEEEWPQIWPFLLGVSHSPNHEMKQVALRMIGDMAESMEDQIGSCMQTLKPIFRQSLVEQGNVKIHMEALKSMTAYLVLAKPKEVQSYNEFFRPMMDVFAQALNHHQEETARTILESFITLAEEATSFFRPQMEGTLMGLIHIMSNRQWEDLTRQSALELIVTLVENSPALIRKTTGLCERILYAVIQTLGEMEDDPEWHEVNDLESDDLDNNSSAAEEALDRISTALRAKAILPHVYQMLPQLCNHAEWNYKYAGAVTIATLVESCSRGMLRDLRRLMGMVVLLIHDQHPLVRYGACSCLAQFADMYGEDDFAEEYRQPFLDSILKTLADPSARVQAQATRALIGYCENCDSELIQPYMNAILDRLLVLLRNPRRYLQEHGLMGIAMLAESAQAAFSQYYDAIMPLLKQIMQQATNKEYRTLRGRAMECATLIGHAVGKERFVADAREVIELIRLGIPVVSGGPDAAPELSVDPDDPQTSFMLPALTRIARIMGRDFVDYLPIFVVPLMKMAQIKPEVRIEYKDQDVHPSIEAHSSPTGQEDSMEDTFASMVGGSVCTTPATHPLEKDQEGWQYLELSQQRVAIKTSVLDDKHTSIELLRHLVQAMEDTMYPYADALMNALLPQLRFVLHDECRASAALACTAVLSCVRKATNVAQTPEVAHVREQKLQELETRVLGELISVAREEEEPDVLTSYLEGVKECVEIMGEVRLSQEHLSAITAMLHLLLMRCINESYHRRARHRGHPSAGSISQDGSHPTMGEHVDGDEEGGESDEEDIEEDENESQILTSVSDVIHALFMNMRERFLVYFEQLLPAISQMLHPHPPDTPVKPSTEGIISSRASTSASLVEIQWALCFFDDLVEYTGPLSYHYHTYFVDAFIHGIAIDSREARGPEIRQAAAFGAGLCAMYGGEKFASLCVQFVPVLMHALQNSDVDSVEWILATENCVSALGKIAQFNASQLPTDFHDPSSVMALMCAWFIHLPILNDSDEAAHVYPVLCQLLEAHHPTIFENIHISATNKDPMQHAAYILAQAIGEDVIEEKPELTNRMIFHLRHILSQLSPATTQSILGTLSEHGKAKVASHLG